MNEWITPAWPKPSNVEALFTTRGGGFSSGPYASLNLGDHVGDDPAAVRRNRAAIQRIVPNQPQWLKQEHGTKLISIDAGDSASTRSGDAAFSRSAGNVCAVLVADCLPVLLCDPAGSTVAVIHAGWRGLVKGIIEKTVSGIRQETSDDTGMMAWLGPAIGPRHFEVGDEVRRAFILHDNRSALAFVPHPIADGKWLADIFLLARLRLEEAGVTEIYGGTECTFSDPARFFSYRRDGASGRMAGIIWLSANP